MKRSIGRWLVAGLLAAVPSAALAQSQGGSTGATADQPSGAAVTPSPESTAPSMRNDEKRSDKKTGAKKPGARAESGADTSNQPGAASTSSTERAPGSLEDSQKPSQQLDRSSDKTFGKSSDKMLDSKSLDDTSDKAGKAGVNDKDDVATAPRKQLEKVPGEATEERQPVSGSARDEAAGRAFDEQAPVKKDAINETRGDETRGAQPGSVEGIRPHDDDPGALPGSERPSSTRPSSATPSPSDPATPESPPTPKPIDDLDSTR